MVNQVNYETATWADAPQKFEGGTPNIAGAIGLGGAVDFIQEIGWETIQKNERELVEYLFSKLPKFVNIIGSNLKSEKSGIISFTIDGVHPHDIAEILNRHNVAIRAGHHCTMPLMKHLGITGTARVSLAMYNTKEDTDKLIIALEEVKNIFKK
jgi:cysteine desulfurase/selenocysteine lyase